LIAGFPDRVGRKRSIDSREVLLASGVGVKLAPAAQVGEWMVAITITAGPHKRAPLIRVAATLNPTCLVTSWAEEVFFDKNKEAVVQRTVRRWGAILIAEKPSPQQATPSDIARVLEDAARPRVNRLFPLDGPEKRLLARLRFAARAHPDEAWPTWLAEPTVLLNEWCMGRRSFAALKKLDVAADLLGRIPWDLRKKLDQIAPERMRVPSGSMVQMEYPVGAPPVLAARVQQMFGMLKTPTLGGVPITVHLLAPNGRPTQVTSDLAHFWANSYALVRKDLRGRYPRHAWPEDPSTAIPENRPRKKRHR
jgi:ATP-dependent helicase HrpB